LAGANFIYAESGDSGIMAYGYRYPAEHAFCETYRRTFREFANYVKLDTRPSDGPLVKIGFIHGHLDGFTGWGGATAWNQFDREAWGFSAAENSWNIPRWARPP